MRRLLFSLVAVAAIAGAAAAQPAVPERAVATFAGGCFWCVESDFDHVPGVLETISGYTGGKVANPTYSQVSAGGTGHAESVEIVFDPVKVSYAQLLEIYWRSIDPFAKDQQFCDYGNQYRTAIFYHDEEQKRLAEESKQKLQQRFPEPIATEIVPAGAFYAAEDYHQDFHNTNSLKYKFYRWNCGRDQRLEQIWGAHKGDS